MSWKPSVVSGYETRLRGYRNGVAQRYRVRGFRGIARRYVDRSEETVKCDHVHQKRSTALACAEKLVRDLAKDVVL